MSSIEDRPIGAGLRPWHASVRPRLFVGALAGLIAALLTDQLGAWDVVGFDPQYALLIAGFAGAIIGYFRGNVVLHLANMLLFIVYAVVAYTPVMSHVSGAWVRRDAVPATPLDAIVVLSSGVLPDSGLDAFGTERLLSGLELWRLQRGTRLLTSRVSATYDGRTLTTDADQARLIDVAAARSAWTVLDSVASTHDEAVRAERLLGRGKRIAVVTSPMHTQRACRTFETVGFSVYCVAARVRSLATTGRLSPRGRLASFRSYLYERAATLRYRMRGWV